MFNPYAESLSSTGEPPTDSLSSSDNFALNTSSAQTIASNANSQEANNLSLSSSSSRSLSVLQEPDSGYEASPSSIADNQRFFGEQSNATRQSGIRESLNSEDEYDNSEYFYPIQFSDSDSDLDEYDTCQDCSSSPLSCSRTDSSTTNCDNSRCNSSDLSTRQQSQPIQIPNMPSRRTTSSRTVVGSLVDNSSSRSQPASFSPRPRPFFIQEQFVPFSWPSIVSPLRNFFLPRRDPVNRNNYMNIVRINRPVISRRQIIDSDASSFGSSEDEEGPEDVFNTPSREPPPSYSTMMTISSVPLPDLVLVSTDTGRRTRSMSVNLPPDPDLLQDVGRRLRRMSDLFSELRMSRGRSRTTSDCDHLRRSRTGGL